MTSSPAPTLRPNEACITIPASATLVARFGGTAALLAAGAISASTLYHLGLLVGMAPPIAWLLPAAFDIYAACAIFTGYRVPLEHPARGAALRNARVALRLTIGCNALDHVLTLAGALIPPSARDALLVTVASLPPLIVERLLHLQTLLVPYEVAGRPETKPSAYDGLGIQDVDDYGQDGREPQNVRACEPVQPRPATPRKPGNTAGRHHLETTALVEIARPVYQDLAERSGGRPGERAFHLKLTEAVVALTQAGRLPGGTRPPSLSTAKRIRTLIENAQPGEGSSGGRTP